MDPLPPITKSISAKHLKKLFFSLSTLKLSSKRRMELYNKNIYTCNYWVIILNKLQILTNTLHILILIKTPKAQPKQNLSN
jgi:hypothetical protein